MNERIRAREVRLIDENGGQMGIVAAREALRIAQERDLDLIEVAPRAQPPVCRIMDYGKHKYQQAKRRRDAHKKHKGSEVRVLVVRNPQIAQHDLEIKLRKLREMLHEGDKVRINLRLRGRQMSRPQLGIDVLNRVARDIGDVAQVEAPPRREGRVISMLVAPKPGLKAAVPKKAKAAPDGEKQVEKEQAERPPVAERPREAEDAEDSGEAG